jgi:hypothetical protein
MTRLPTLLNNRTCMCQDMINLAACFVEDWITDHICISIYGRSIMQHTYMFIVRMAGALNNSHVQGYRLRLARARRPAEVDAPVQFMHLMVSYVYFGAASHE